MSLFPVYSPFQINLTRAKGSYVYDETGRGYLDLYGGHGVISIGHAHPTYVEALRKQIGRIGFYSNSILMPLQEELAGRLQEISGYDDYRLFLCNSGAEATENALKLASFQTGRRGMVAFRKSFHGRTGAALRVTDNPKISPPLIVDSFPVEFFELEEQEALTTLLQREETAAVIVEGIQGVGGLGAPSAEYLSFLREVCDRTGTLLILDEVQSGFGRSGNFFAHQIAPIRADIVAMAKGMGNGFPVGGLLIGEHLHAFPGMLGTTFGGNHLACTAALAVLQVLEEEQLMDRAKILGEEVHQKLAALPGVRRVRGRGLMLGPEFDFPVKTLRNRLLHEHGIFTGSSSNPNLLRLLPPLSITQEEIKPLFGALKECLSHAEMVK